MIYSATVLHSILWTLVCNHQHFFTATMKPPITQVTLKSIGLLFTSFSQFPQKLSSFSCLLYFSNCFPFAFYSSSHFIKVRLWDCSPISASHSSHTQIFILPPICRLRGDPRQSSSVCERHIGVGRLLTIFD